MKKSKNIVEESIEYLKYIKDYRKIDILKENVSIIEADYSDILTDAEVKEEIEPTIYLTEQKEPKLFSEDWEESTSLPELDSKINKCTKCRLGSTRKNFVFGKGNPSADVVVIGEAPGGDEDGQGIRFVGRAGKLLTDIWEAINFSRDDVFICNIIKCRPPANRNPLPDEIKQCEPYLFKQLKIINPSFILCVGTFAAQTLLKTKEPLGKLRGKFFDFTIEGKIIKTLITYHPAALLRNPNWKRPTWEDVQMFKKEYDKWKGQKNG